MGKKAIDEDGISAELYKALDGKGIAYLTDMYNRILSNELEIPEQWHTNSYVMVPKASDAKTADEYRAIAILHIFLRS